MAGNKRRSNGSKRTSVLKWLRRQSRPCHICGLPIDYGLPPGDAECFECDELAPVSKGGSPYDRANVDAAHRCCNNWRRARGMDEVASIRQAALSRYGAWSTPLEFVCKANACSKADTLSLSMARFGTLRTTTDW